MKGVKRSRLQFPVHLYLVGLKGAVFLEKFLQYDTPVTKVVSYKPKYDRSNSFEKIASLASRFRLAFVESKSEPIDPKSLTFLVGWQFLVKKTNENTVVFHDSLLPSLRGFSPTVTALINGQKRIGVSALLPREEADTGPVIAKKAFSIRYPIKIYEALCLQATQMAAIAYDLTTHRGPLSVLAESQDERRATYSLWLEPRDFFIDWNRSAPELKRMIDAFGYPYTGARTRSDSLELVIDDANVVADQKIENREPGKVVKFIDKSPVVACGAGLLRLTHYTSADRSAVPVIKLQTRFYR